MKKLSSAVFLASLSMLAQQANAESKIEIDTSKVDPLLFETVKANINTKAAQSIINRHSYSFSNSIMLDGVADVIDIDAYWATTKADSTKTSASGAKGLQSVYTACHTACHGSRGWR